MKLVSLGLALKDSPPGFDPSAAASDYPTETSWADTSVDVSHDDGQDYAETEQL
jgi:DNA-directed RNA polymerase subunit alpha